jgi:hypothetical protein
MAIILEGTHGITVYFTDTPYKYLPLKTSYYGTSITEKRTRAHRLHPGYQSQDRYDFASMFLARIGEVSYNTPYLPDNGKSAHGQWANIAGKARTPTDHAYP